MNPSLRLAARAFSLTFALVLLFGAATGVRAEAALLRALGAAALFGSLVLLAIGLNRALPSADESVGHSRSTADRKPRSHG